MIYVPNVGEKEMIKSILAAEGVVLGLYRNNLQGDGALTIDSITELPTGGGRGYAPIELTAVVAEGAAAADKWMVDIDGNGKAAALFDNVDQQWTFNAADVADGYTAYGVFAYTFVLPFDSGSIEIKPGDIIKGVSSGAYGTVTSVLLTSGSWAAGTAAGEIRIRAKTGTFQNDEAITKVGAIATFAVNTAGTDYAVGDIITVTQTGASGARLVVTGVDAYGGVTSLVVVDGGLNYSVDTDLATVALTGTGNNDLVLDISTLATTDYATTNTGTGADAVKKLLYIDPFSTPQLITPAGFAIQYPAALTLSSAS